MKVFKFVVTLLSAAMTAYSPVSMAAMDIAQKNQFNRRIKEEYVGNGKTYNDLYQEKGFLFDARTRSALETWLTVHGSEKVTAPEAQIIKDKNGHESVKLIVSAEGKTLAVTLSETDPETVEINGVKIPRYELPAMGTVLQRLAEKDSNFKGLFQAVNSAKLPPPKKSDMVSYHHFDKLPALAKVEYMMRLRQTLESAQQVVSEARTLSAQSEKPSSHFVFHPLFVSLIAQAAVAVGDRCYVAGNLSMYEKNSRLECSINPSSFDNNSLPAFNKQCDSNEGDVACNPLLYGAQSNGKPHCVRSGTKDFTLNATAHCNKKSPLSESTDKNSRNQDYERILKSYYALKNGSKEAEKIKDCFDASHKVAETCVSFFQPQLDSFANFIQTATELCGPNSPLATGAVGTPDQPKTCKELLTRALELKTFLLSVNILPRPVKLVDIEEQACLRLRGAKWNGKETARSCSCPDSQPAVPGVDPDGKGYAYSCPVPLLPSPKESCRKENGEKSYSFKCSPLPYLIAGGISLALLWPKDKDKPQQPPLVIPPVAKDPIPRPPHDRHKHPLPKLPVVDVPVPPTAPPATPPSPPVVVIPPPVQVPPAPPAPPPPARPTKEGGEGTSPGSNDGIRTSK